jgi:hypothetical protein
MAAVMSLHRPVRRVVALGRSLSQSELRILQESLGDGFVVEEGWIESDDDVVIAPVLSEPVIGLIKSRHPGCLILCLLPQVGDSAEVVEALDNGADACVVRPTMAELTAHLKALVRLSYPSGPSVPSGDGRLTDRLASA